VELGARSVGHRQADGVALDLGGPTGHVTEQLGGQRHVRGPGHGERLAVVECLELGELLQVLVDEIADPPHDPAPFRWRHTAPRTVFEGPSGGTNGQVDVDRVALSDGGECFTRSRVDRLKGLAGLGVDQVPIDKQLPASGNEIIDALVQSDSAHGLFPDSPALWRG
jgi:hypothetical protein